MQKENNELYLTESLDRNIHVIRSVFVNDDTLIIRLFQNSQNSTWNFSLFFIEGMVKEETINRNIIQPIIDSTALSVDDQREVLSILQKQIIQTSDVRLLEEFDEMMATILSGDTLLLIDGFNKGIGLKTKGWQTRAITDPETEKLIRGPREGFNESLMINLSLIRRKIQSTDLKFEFKTMGERTRTKICICYLESLAKPQIIKELYERLNKIQIDGILDSGYIQELIQDARYLPLNTIGNTERPDVIAANLLEGRIAIIVDGSPVVLTLPYLFMEYFQSNEDYYINYLNGSINRILRIVGVFLTTSVPAIYVALLTYHQEMIPTSLLLSIAATREGVPLPTIIEAYLLLVVFEMLREAGVRLPTQLGQTISIVGALVIGQAAVAARLVSAPMVIVVALTGITGLLIPQLKGSNILLRYLLLLLAGFLGLYGYAFGFMGFMLLLFSLRSFGVPYMLSINAFKKGDMKDVVFRAPLWRMKNRNELIAKEKERYHEK